MKVESREYKLLIAHEPFVDPSRAALAVWDEIEEAVHPLQGVGTKGGFEEQKTRTIVFLDTPDHTLRRSGLVLRRRTGADGAVYTLKCRSEDRYFAAGTDVSAAGALGAEAKLEEDIAAPFRCLFAHSVTISSPAMPTTLHEASSLFPLLGTLRADGRSCAPETTLEEVNHIRVNETVWKGGKIVFELGGGHETEKASVALILWARGKKGRPAVAELSFRLEDENEHFSRALAEAARALYITLQRLDCARPGGRTKTAYVYRDTSQN